MVRQRYAAEAVEAAVITGVTEHGDDFVLSIDRHPAAGPATATTPGTAGNPDADVAAPDDHR
jgi:hypothetical protein